MKAWRTQLKTSNYGTAWCRARLHAWLIIWRSWVWAPSKAPVVSLSKKHYVIA